MLTGFEAAQDMLKREDLSSKPWHEKNFFEDKIRQINADQDLLYGLLEDTITRIAKGETHRFLTSQQIIIGQNQFLGIRINLWPALDEDSKHTASEKALYSYEAAHDHNFTFLTIGHFGPGYETNIYEYDRKEVRGVIGEKVNIRFRETITLAPEKTYWFHSGREIHDQQLPASLSASINIMFKDEFESSQPQFYFDLRTRTISSLTDNTVSKQKNFLDLCSYFDDERCEKVLQIYANDDREPLLQAHAQALLGA